MDYVKDLKENIEDLERKREKLKNTIYSDDDEDKIIVKSCNEGVEISIKGGVSLSKVLKVLMKEELIVNSCVSSTINQRLIHIIQTKVSYLIFSILNFQLCVYSFFSFRKRNKVMKPQ